MIVEKMNLWEDNNPACYTSYLMDNSEEIEAERKHPAMIICGGGAFMGISDREKEPVALYFLNHGYQCFVLDYNTESAGNGRYPIPVYDLAKMILTIRLNADKWNIAPDKVAAIGFSAGAHLCACLSTQWHEKYLTDKLRVNSDLLKPNAVILGYPLVDYIYEMEHLENDEGKDIPPASMPMSKTEAAKRAVNAGVGEDVTKEMFRNASPFYRITQETCPTFIWHTATDELVYVGQSLRYAEKLSDCKVPFELHIFESGVHGLSLANEQSGGGTTFIEKDVSIWPELAIKFLDRNLK